MPTLTPSSVHREQGTGVKRFATVRVKQRRLYAKLSENEQVVQLNTSGTIADCATASHGVQ